MKMKRDDLIAFLECMLSVLREEEYEEIAEADLGSLIEETDAKYTFFIGLMKKICEGENMEYPGDRHVWEVWRNLPQGGL